MWSLVSSRGQVYTLTPGKVHTVSRKAGDILLADDQSVSRKHAYLEVRTPATDGVFVWDDSSKYGTFVNQGITYETKLAAGIKATIKEGARVRFGLQEMNIWVLKQEGLCVCAHMLKATEINKLKAVLSSIGGKLVDNWTEDSTHLTTNSLRLTHEVMLALASAKPIVSFNFWDSYLSGNRPNLPKFMPPVEDNRLSGKDYYNCLPNPARKTIFKDKLFIFPSSESWKAYKNVIELAGGTASKLSDCGMSLSDYCKPNVIVISCTEKYQTSFYNKVLSKVIEENRRFIPEEDIGLALWKISIAVHCNPLYSPNNGILRMSQATAHEKDPDVILVMSSEDVGAPSVAIEDDKIIPPTLSENLFSTEDRTQSISLNLPQKNCSTPSVAGPSRKRSRDASMGRSNCEDMQNSIISDVVKQEPTEEEDLFAEDDVPRPSTSSSTISFTDKSAVKRGKRLSTRADPDGFFLPSPPKRKKVKKSVEVDEESMFDLPKEPMATKVTSNEDDFDFLDDSKFNNSIKSAKENAGNESRDLFETSEDLGLASSSASRGEKRKMREDSELDNKPSKKLSKLSADMSNTPGTSNSSRRPTQFLSKANTLKVKKEETNPIKTEEQELAMRFSAKVVIAPLVKRSFEDRRRNVSADSTVPSGKNFKKFKKAWSETSVRRIISTSVYRPNAGRASDPNSEAEDEDDPFLPSRPAAPRRPAKKPNHDDDDDEFALPSFSQVM